MECVRKHQFILCGEDDPDDQFLFSTALALIYPDKLYDLKFANNGMQVVDELGGLRVPDILFLDLNMPQKNGLECLREIRADIRFNNLPIIILSTSTSVTDIRSASALGANCYAVKPMEFDRLSQILTTCLTTITDGTRKMPPEDFIVL